MKLVREEGAEGEPIVVRGRCVARLVGPEDRRLLAAVAQIVAEALAQLGHEDFISLATHELRTPVAIVHGITTTLHLRRDELPDDQVQQLSDALYEQSTRLRDLTEKLLDLSRLDAGRMRVEPRAFRPRETVEMLVSRIAPDRVGEVQVDIDPRVEVVSDPNAFEHVVGNLIGNALKHGEPPVLVHGNGDERRFRLLVEDRGPGVPDEFVPHLFERFTRAHELTHGTGLGLAIAHELADALGAELDYEPAEPRGARFVLSLPREARP